jgi:hypothetical protein
MDYKMSYAVNLGGGLYMDSNGVLHRAQPPEVPIYNAPFVLPVEPEKIQKALEGANKFLADADDPKNSGKFTKLGVPIELFDLLSGIGKVAGIIAPYIAAIAIAYDCLRIFGVIKGSSGPTPLEQMITLRFDQIQKTIVSLATLIQQQNLEQGKNDIQNFMAFVKTHNEQLQNANPNLKQLEDDLTRLLNEHTTNLQGVTKLLSPATYLALFDPNEHKKVWPFMQHLLNLHPAGSASPALAKMPGPGDIRFDHRMMVPLASFAAEVYLACIRGISPEYRTTGDFRDHLRGMALKLDALAKNMLDFGLSRTIYKSTDFSMVQLKPWEVTGNVFTADEDRKVAPTCNRFPVGALDLRYHNDAFFGVFLNELWNNEWLGKPYPTKYGSMEFRWMPPAKLKRVDMGTITDPIVFVITNPEECAAAANEVSKQDYADLLLSSGYSNMLHLGALFRNESTEPSKSQTVHGDVYLSRSSKPAVSVVVKSDPIVMTGVIESNASRVPQDCKALAKIWTQTIKRSRPIEYTVNLRTLSHIRPTYLGPVRNRWRETVYSDFQATQHEMDPQHKGFLKLDIFNNKGIELDDHLLIAGSSPRERRTVEGEVEMKAHTFDWWIPIKAPFSLEVDVNKTYTELRRSGWTGPLETTVTLDGKIATVPLAYKISPGTSTTLETDFTPFLNGEQNWDGEHREVLESTVKIEYKLSWEEDRMTISLKSRSSDRNYIVFIVLEEKMLYSGQILHTAFPVAVNGQLTYVPQKFFDEERKAWEKLAKAVNEFNDKYSLSTEINPQDPIIGWARPNDFNSREGLEQIIALAEQHQPELLKRVMTANGFRKEAKVVYGV